MDPFGLKPDSVVARTRASGTILPLPSHSRSLLLGALGFGLASLAVFGTVAFGERWMYRSLGLTGAYLVWTLLFIALAGGLLSPLVIGPGRLARFLGLFFLAFFLYSVGWTAAYFSLSGLAGEWFGSVAGTFVMALVMCWAFGSLARFSSMALILFAGNSLGYFAGSALYSYLGGKIGMLLWGLCYGLGLGIALGHVLYQAQTPVRALLSDPFATRA